TLHRGRGDGTFEVMGTYSVGQGPDSLAVGDFDGDGLADIAVTHAHDSRVFVLRPCQPWPWCLVIDSYDFGPWPDPTYTHTLASDLNGDGRPDLVVTSLAGNSLNVLLNQGDGTFGPPTAYATGRAPYSVVAGDINHDGLPDLVVANCGSGSLSI